MSAAASAQLLLTGTAWRVTGLDAAGRRLVAAAAAGAEDEQTIAAMLLVRAGDRSVPLVDEALRRDSASLVLVDVLASIGTPDARAVLARCAGDTTSADVTGEGAGKTEVAAAARAALRALAEIDDLGR